MVKEGILVLIMEQQQQGLETSDSNLSVYKQTKGRKVMFWNRVLVVCVGLLNQMGKISYVKLVKVIILD